MRNRTRRHLAELWGVIQADIKEVQVREPQGGTNGARATALAEAAEKSRKDAEKKAKRDTKVLASK